MFSRPCRRHARRIAVAVATAAAVALLAGCASDSPSGTPQPIALGHVHAVIPAEDGTILVGSHTGLYTIGADGGVDGPVGGYDFDAMGLTAVGDALVASGHPGPETPAELGSPNLGIIRSEDRGQSWQPVAFTGQEDFHVLSAGADGRLYGIGSSSPAVGFSDDAGATWSVAADVAAVDLAVGGDGIVYAATPDAVLASSDGAATFQALPDAPVLYLLDAVGDDLVGVSTDGQLWRQTDGAWSQAGSADGPVEAIGLSLSGMIYLVDDRGIVAVDGEQTRIVLPAR